MMERIQKIIDHPAYRTCLVLIEETEKHRLYCRHDIEHFLAVARIAYIINLEENLGISKEVIYGAALLHDIGKYEQYVSGIPHEEAGVRCALPILEDSEFTAAEREQILSAIKTHRNAKKAGIGKLNELLYRADKQSRTCLVCQQQESCKWEKKNRFIFV